MNGRRENIDTLNVGKTGVRGPHSRRIANGGPLRRTPGIAIVALLIASAADCQIYDERPKELEGIDIVEHLNAKLPLDAEFVTSNGRTVALGRYFNQDRPVILTLNYYACPMLCTYQLNGLVDGLREVDFQPGRDYQIVTVSFDPDEGPDLAARKKKNYVESLQRPGAENGWAFLTGTEENIKKVTEAVGFGYRWNEEQNQWAHGAALFIATPEGRLSRYLYGIAYEPNDLRLALIEGGEGKVGSTIDRFLMWCFHYDDKTGQYTPHVMRIMRLAGGIMVTVLAVGLLILWRQDAKRRARRKESEVAPLGGW